MLALDLIRGASFCPDGLKQYSFALDISMHLSVQNDLYTPIPCYHECFCLWKPYPFSQGWSAGSELSSLAVQLSSLWTAMMLLCGVLPALKGVQQMSDASFHSLASIPGRSNARCPCKQPGYEDFPLQMKLMGQCLLPSNLTLTPLPLLCILV